MSKLRFTTIRDAYDRFREYSEEEPDNPQGITQTLVFDSGKPYGEITADDLSTQWEEVNATPEHWVGDDSTNATQIRGQCAVIANYKVK